MKLSTTAFFACLSFSLTPNGFAMPELPFCPAGGPPGWFNYFNDKQDQNRWQRRNNYRPSYRPAYPPVNYYQNYYRPAREKRTPYNTYLPMQNTGMRNTGAPNNRNPQFRPLYNRNR